MRHKDLGQLLLEARLINQETLDKALELQKKSNSKFGETLVSMGAVTENELLKLLSKQLNIPIIDLYFYDFDMSLVNLLPESYAREYNAIVLGRKTNALLVGIVDPMDINAIDAISRILKQPIATAIVGKTALLSIFNRVYRRTKEIVHFAKELSVELGEDLDKSSDQLFDANEDVADSRAPVVKLLYSLFRDAIQANASDIHIEPDEHVLRIRYRIDGILNEYVFDEKRIAVALVQRLKLRANLDISEHRSPQDGNFSFEMNGQAHDVRLSTIPTVHGESLVMRLLRQSFVVEDLSEMGMSKEMLARIEAISMLPFGMLLVTGPTGSGKSTTLYSLLSKLNTPERKIITVEDPVEYHIPRVSQVQVNPVIDLTFAKVLRSILRQDPDVIMVGEIRDSETALIAMRAAITGHLVLATLHTNSAWSSAMRLIDMGSDGFMVAAAVKAIVGQRLVRKLCKACAVEHEPDELEQAWFKSLNVDPATIQCKDAKGCSHCGSRGYLGRVGVYELLVLDNEMMTALRLNDVTRFVKAVTNCESYKLLAQSVLDLVRNGVTSVNEAIRVVGPMDEAFKY